MDLIELIMLKVRFRGLYIPKYGTMSFLCFTGLQNLLNVYTLWKVIGYVTEFDGKKFVSFVKTTFFFFVRDHCVLPLQNSDSRRSILYHTLLFEDVHLGRCL